MLKPVVVSLATGIAGLLIGVSVTKVSAQEPQKPLTIRDFPDLGKGLQETPGCLGVTSVVAGKQFVIFAWFKNKGAVNAWYHSKMHIDAMKKFFPTFEPKDEALASFKDEKAPVMMIAAVTPGEKTIPNSPLAVNQISIEAYTPVPGGVAYGGTFAPDQLKVPGMMRITGN